MTGSSQENGGGLGALIGIESIESGPERARARVAVRDEIGQPHGVVHGGAYATLAESVCSKATDDAVAPEGMVAMGQSNNVSFLRPISSGHVNATATVRHRGRTTWIWDCEITDDGGRLCALARITIAVRPAPNARPG